MSSTKTERKLSSWFWWILTALPLIEYISFIIMKIVNLNTQGGTPMAWYDLFSYFTGGDNGFAMFLDSDLFSYNFSDLIPTPLLNSIQNLFDTLGVENNYFANFLAWGIAVQLYRILFDFACLLPRLARKYLNRGFGVND